MLDVNVWVNHYLSLSRGRQGSAAQRLVRAAFDGHCRLGPIQPVVSHAMLDTLQAVLVRLDLPEPLAEAARNAVEASAIGGVGGRPPYGMLGGGVQPLADFEDRAVLETAIAGQADLLVTNDMADFTPGPRADIDAGVLRRDARGQAEALLLAHPSLQHGLVIATVPAAGDWLLDGEVPPSGALGRFVPDR